MRGRELNEGPVVKALPWIFRQASALPVEEGQAPGPVVRPGSEITQPCRIVVTRRKGLPVPGDAAERGPQRQETAGISQEPLPVSHPEHRRNPPLLQQDGLVDPPEQRLVGGEHRIEPLLVRAHDDQLAGGARLVERSGRVDQVLDGTREAKPLGGCVMEFVETHHDVTEQQVVHDITEIVRVKHWMRRRKAVKNAGPQLTLHGLQQPLPGGLEGFLRRRPQLEHQDRRVAADPP